MFLDYGEGGDHFDCTVEPSPGHIRCRLLQGFRPPRNFTTKMRAQIVGNPTPRLLKMFRADFLLSGEDQDLTTSRAAVAVRDDWTLQICPVGRSEALQENMEVMCFAKMLSQMLFVDFRQVLKHTCQPLPPSTSVSLTQCLLS